MNYPETLGRAHELKQIIRVFTVQIFFLGTMKFVPR